MHYIFTKSEKTWGDDDEVGKFFIRYNAYCFACLAVALDLDFCFVCCYDNAQNKKKASGLSLCGLSLRGF